MKKGIYFLIPCKNSIHPTIVVDQCKCEMKEIIPIDIEKWRSKVDERYNSLFLVRIFDIPKEKESNIRVKLEHENAIYWNRKDQIIKLIPNERNEPQVYFFFSLIFMNPKTKITYPEKMNIISLFEEIAYLKQYFFQEKEWKDPGPKYFLIDLINHICKHPNEKIEIGIFLFIFKRTIVREHNSFLQFIESQREIKSIELHNLIMIDELQPKNVRDTFIKLIENKTYEVKGNFVRFKGKEIAIRNLIKEYFTLYLVKFDSANLVHFMEKFNNKPVDNSKRLISILTDPNNYDLFNSIGINDEHICSLVKCCSTGSDLSGLFKFIKNKIELLENILKDEEKVRAIKQIGTNLKKPINIIFNLQPMTQEQLYKYIENCKLFVQCGFNNININNRYLTLGIIKLEYLDKILEFISKFPETITKMDVDLKIQKKINKSFLRVQKNKDNLEMILMHFNSIQTHKSQEYLKKIVIDILWIKDLVKDILNKTHILECNKFINDFSQKYPKLNPIMKTSINKIFYEKVIQTINDKSIKNQDLLNLLLKCENRDKLNLDSYVGKISELISFESKTDLFTESFKNVIKNFFKKDNTTEKSLYENIFKHLNSLIELLNFMEIITSSPLNFPSFIIQKSTERFLSLIESCDKKKEFDIIKKCFLIIIDVNPSLAKGEFDNMHHKLQISLEEKDFTNILYEIYKSPKTSYKILKSQILSELLKKITVFTPDEIYQIIMDNQNNNQLLTDIFKEKSKVKLTKDDFFEESKEFKLFIKLLKGGIFNFQKPFDKLKSETYFKNLNQHLKNIQESITKNDYTFKDIKSMHRMLTNNTLETNLTYLYLGKRPQQFEKLYQDLVSIIQEFIDYEQKIKKAEAFDNYFNGNQIRKEIKDIKEAFNTKKISELKVSCEEAINTLVNLGTNAEGFVELLGSKFFDILYKQATHENEDIRRNEAKKKFDNLDKLLDITKYLEVPSEVLNDIVYFCKEEEIESEFKFLQNYFPSATVNKPEEVKKKIILGSNKNNMLKFVEATKLLCEEYEVQKTPFLEKYNSIEADLKKVDLSLTKIQEIEEILSENVLNFRDINKDYIKIIKMIHNKKIFFDFIRDKTGDSIKHLNQFIEDIDNQFLSPSDIPRMEEVVNFFADLRTHKGKRDIEFLEKFKRDASNKKIAGQFEVCIQKIFSFKDLYDKISNNSEFSINKIKEILENSSIIIQNNEEQFGGIDSYIIYKTKRDDNKVDVRLTIEELFEIKDKAKLKMKNVDDNSQNEMNKTFEHIVQDIETLLEIIHKLLEKGDSQLHKFTINIKRRKIKIITGEHGTEEDIEIKQLINELQIRLEDVTRGQKNAYKKPTNSILTFFYGKRIYQLNQFLQQGKGLEQLEPILKFISKNKYDRRKTQKLQEDFIYRRIENLNEFMEECLGPFLDKFLQIHSIKIDDIFNDSLIKQQHATNTPAGIYTSYLTPQAKFDEIIMKIYLRYTGNFPLPQTLMICNQNTTLEEITAFIYRGLYYPKKALFGITQTEQLSNEIQEKILSIFEEEYLNRDKINSVFVLFYTNIQSDIKNQMSQKNIEKIFNQLEDIEVDISSKLKDIEIIHSDSSGVGKSYYINKKTVNENKIYEYFPIGGDFFRENIIKRLSNIKFESGKTVLHLDIHETKKIHLMKDFLFSFLILKSYFYKNYLFYLDKKIEIKIELPFGFIDYFKLFPLLNLVQAKENISKNKLPLYDIPTDINSDEQFVCNILKLYKENKISNTHITHKNYGGYEKEEQTNFEVHEISKPLSQNECLSIIKTYFNIQKPTFYQLKIYFSILSEQFKKFLTDKYLDPDLLLENGRAKNIENLNKVRDFVITSLNKLTVHFTKGAYEDILEKQNIAYKSQGEDYNIEKAEENALKALENKKHVSFNDIKPSLLLFNQDGQSLSVVTTIKKDTTNQEDQKEYNDLKNLMGSGTPGPNKDLNDYSSPQFTNEMFLAELVKILDISKKTIKDEKGNTYKNFPSNTNLIPKFLQENVIGSYVFTQDNFAKLIFILIRIRAKIPVLLMGETGCGKTFLIRTMSKLYGSKLEILNIHAGTTENDIIGFIQERGLFENQKTEIKGSVWLFLDEINTCNALGLISEIMIKSSANNLKLKSNVTIIGACNPYRILKSSNKDNCGISTKTQTKKINLVYTVNSLPHSLLNYVMDFGNLKNEDEEKYIRSMVETLIAKKCEEFKLSKDKIKQHQNWAVQGIIECQNYFKTHSDISAVSLREVKRFCVFYEWFIPYLLMKVEDPHYQQCKNNVYTNLYKQKQGCNFNQILKYSSILAIYICYYLRTSNISHRQTLNQKLSAIFGEIFSEFPTIESIDITDRVQIPKGIALNSAFLDNLYGLFVCTNTKVPVIICGKPGCSKSLSMQILISAMKGEYSENYLFRNLPRLNITSFQGAKTSTSEGVLNAFDKARSVLKGNKQDEKIISLLFFDEMGLAELSENNPLKVIHAQLEYDDNDRKQIAFIGISNWTLDASKMNRCVFLAILEPDKNNLEMTALQIAESYKHGLSKPTENMQLLKTLSRTYFDYKTHLRKNTEMYYDYHGLRDFYNLIKCACKYLNSPIVRQTDMIARMSVERNLGGLSLGKNDSVYECKKILNGLLHESDPIATNYNVLERITENINDFESRFLLILSKSSNVQFLIELLLTKENKDYIFYNGSQFEEDKKSQIYNIRMLTKMKQAAEEGKVLCLLNLDYLYPSYYDVFNQNYTVIDGKNYAKVALGTNTNIQTYIHPKFRVFVLLDSKCLEKKETLPETPFLNRFDKHLVSYEDLYQNSKEDNGKLFKELEIEFYGLLQQLMKLNQNIKPEDIMIAATNCREQNGKKLQGLMFNCSREEIQGIIYKIYEETQEQEKQKYISPLWDRVIKLFPQDLLAYSHVSELFANKGIIDQICKSYKTLKNASLKQYLENTSHKKSIIYTFSPYISTVKVECESEFPNIGKRKITNDTIHQTLISSINMETELEKVLLDYIKHSKHNLCILKFTPTTCKHLNAIRNLIDNLEKEGKWDSSENKPKKIFIIIYLKKFLTKVEYSKEDIEDYTIESGKLISQIAPGYDQIMIDNLFSNDDVNIGNFLKLSNKELLTKCSNLLNFDKMFENELMNCLNKLHYNELGEFAKGIKNIEDYKKQIKTKLLNNKDLLNDCKNIIANEADKLESFFKTVLYSKNEAFTMDYVSFIDVFKNYLRRNFIELLTKLLYTFENEGILYPLLFANENIQEFNKAEFEKFKTNINLKNVEVNFKDKSNPVNFIPGIQIIKIINKIKDIKRTIEPQIKDYIIKQNQNRKEKKQEDDEQLINLQNDSKNIIESQLTEIFGEEYQERSKEIYSDYIKIIPALNNLKETYFFEKLFDILKKKKFGEGDVELPEFILWVESNQDIIVDIFKMYQLFIKETKLNVLEKLISDKEPDLSLNAGLFEVAESLFEMLIKQNTFLTQINKLQNAVKIMSNLNSTLQFNSKYLHECQNIVDVYNFFPKNTRKEYTNEFIKQNDITSKLSYLKEKGKDLPNYNTLIINCLRANYQLNKGENEKIEKILQHLLNEDIEIILASKRLLYLILFDTDKNIEPIFQEEPDYQEDGTECFENVNHDQITRVFTLLNEIENKKEEKQLIIEEHILFIFENIIRVFIDNLIKEAIKNENDDNERKQKEAKIVQMKENVNNNYTDGIAFNYFQKAFDIVKEIIKDEYEKQPTKIVSYLYSVAYIKIYFEYFTKYLIESTQEIGAISKIVSVISTAFGGDNHKSFKQALYYYIFKLCDKNFGTFQLLLEDKHEKTKELQTLKDKINLKPELMTCHELDFPFFDNKNKYKEMERLNLSQDNDQIIKQSLIEFINFLFNTVFAFALDYSKEKEFRILFHGSDFQQELSLFTNCVKSVFANNDIILNCLMLMLECQSSKKGQQRSEFFNDINHLHQKEFTKILFTFKIILIIALQGKEKLQSTYTELQSKVNDNSLNPLQHSLNNLIYYSMQFFARYTPILVANERQNIKTKSKEYSLMKLMMAFEELESKVNYPIEIFLHLFYKKYAPSLNISTALEQTNNEIVNYINTYETERTEIFNIGKNDLKSIIREVYDPQSYDQIGKYLRYFLLSKTITEVEHKNMITELYDENEYPLIYIFYGDEEKAKDIKDLEVLEDLNKFGKEIFNCYNNNILEKDALSRDIRSFLGKDNDKSEERKKLFEKFLASWEKLESNVTLSAGLWSSRASMIATQNQNSKLSDKACILLCLPSEREGTKGYAFTSILKSLINKQNSILRLIPTSTTTDEENKKKVCIQDAVASDIIKLEIKNEEYNLHSINDMFKIFSDRGCFNMDGSFNYRKYNNVTIDNKALHQELINIILEGKPEFDEIIHYFKFKENADNNEIQANLNKEQHDLKNK